MGTKAFAAVMLLAFCGVAALVLLGPSDVSGPAGFPGNFTGSLVVQKNGGFVGVPPATVSGVKYWAFYYSAAWCPPCRTLTPKLIEFYRQFKPTHPNFEFVFISHDLSEGDMLANLRDGAVPWPAVRFGDIDRTKLDHYCGEAIPDLVLVDAQGKVLSDSYDGWTYRGPEKVVADIQTMVPTP